jgi:AAA family ATP:ADP antiporter
LSDKLKSKFEKIRMVFWPIQSYELKKFIPMALMMFCILFNYSLLRSIKDSLIITSLGAEVIPTLKLWFVLPAAIIFITIYSKLVNIFSKNHAFYLIVSIFVMYFTFFITILYPNHQQLHFSLINVHSQYLKVFLKPVSAWIFSSFYVMAELWGRTMIALMFWRFANDVVTLKESRRFYVMFGFIGNFALIIAGSLMKLIQSKSANSEQWTVLPIFVTIIIASCLAIICIYYYITKYVTKGYVNEEFKTESDNKKIDDKPSLIEGLKYIFKSSYLGCIALLVICYGISINLIEVVWKGQIAIAYPTKAAYGSFMGGLQIFTGISTILFTFLGANIVRKTSWFTAAIITPITILFTGIIFFVFISFSNILNPLISRFGFTTLTIVVFIGFLQNCISKGVKYCIFDPTKEMSYIPLDDELKSKGKAVVDVVGTSFGKSGGACILYILLNILFVGSSLIKLVPIITIIFIFILLIWFVALSKLNKKFLNLVKDKY